jgi:16S rRNA processing protein RimM
VVGVENYGAGDLIEIARANGANVLIPFTRAIVPQIDLSAGRLIVDPPAGLLDQ